MLLISHSPFLLILLNSSSIFSASSSSFSSAPFLSFLIFFHAFSIFFFFFFFRFLDLGSIRTLYSSSSPSFLLNPNLYHRHLSKFSFYVPSPSPSFPLNPNLLIIIFANIHFFDPNSIHHHRLCFFSFDPNLILLLLNYAVSSLILTILPSSSSS